MNLTLKSVTLLLSLSLVGIAVSAQQTVHGTLTDEAGRPVIGGSVVVKGTTGGAVADLDGRFTLKDVPTGAVLVFSSIGYETVEAVYDGSPLRIVLKEDTRILDEVVVVGYATMKKRDLVGAVDQVDSKVIADRSNGNLARSLQGEIPGLNITFTDGKPSRNATFNVRGETSIGAGGSSLVLIDGVEGDLNTINPQDVESVSVLKDASSTAVYGARGAFGVILVTTKAARKGQPDINYTGSVSANRRTVIPDSITDGLKWVNWWRDAYTGYYNGSKDFPDHIDSHVPYSEEIYQRLIRVSQDPSLSQVTELTNNGQFSWAYFGSTDWFDLFYKDYNWSHEHNLSISGGNESTDYYVSGRYYNMDGIYRLGNENYDKYDFRAKGSFRVRPWLKVTDNISFSIVNHRQPKSSRDDTNIQKFINHCGNPLSPLRNPDGTWTEAAAITGYSSLAEHASYRDNDYFYLREKLSADVDIIRDVLKFQADYSFNYTDRERTDVQVPTAYSKVKGIILYESESAGESLTLRTYKTRYQAANAYLTFSPDLGTNHSLTALAGYNIEYQRYNTLEISRSDFITYDKKSFSLMTGETSAPVQGGNIWSYEGAFFRLNYGLKGKYLVEASGRYDGSSKFPSYSRWGFFPSASVAWRLSEERFMEWSRSVLDNAKVRLSAGSMGNGNVSPYSYTSEMTVSSSSSLILGGAFPSVTTVGSVVPVSLTWERASTYDIGLDIDLLGSRLSLTGDYYVRKTTDMYTQSVELPAVYGTTSPRGNNASMRTNGWELSIQWRNQFMLGGRPFRYSVKGMLWDSLSRITGYANETGTLGTIKGMIQNGGSPSSYYPGMLVGEIWGYTVVGLFKDQEDIDHSAVQDMKQANDKVTRPGQVKFADLDGSGFIDGGAFEVHDHGDLSIIGNQTPRFRYGINLNASWNGIGLSVFLQGVGRRDWYPGSDAGYFWGKYGRPFFAMIPTIHDYTNPKYADTIYSPALDNWDTAYWPRITTYQSNLSYNWSTVLEIPNTRYIQNAAYLRVKNVQVDYTFPDALLKALRLKGLKVYVSGENLLTFSPLHKWAPNFDPEGLSADPDFASAADGYSYPIFKNVTLGVNVTF